MSARLSSNGSGEATPTELNAGERRHRVVSISPQEARIESVSASTRISRSDTSGPGEAGSVPSAHDPAALLQAAIEESRRCAAQLACMMEQHQQAQALSSATAIDLQDRLRVGARMLQAFDSHLARMEAALQSRQQHEQKLAASEAKIDHRCAALSGRIDEFIRHFEQRVADVLQASLASLEQGASSQVSAMASIENQVSDVTARIGELKTALKACEQRLAAHEDNASPARLDRLADEMRRSVTQEMSWLAATMRSVAQRVEQLAIGMPEHGSTSGHADDREGAAVPELPKRRRQTAGLEGGPLRFPGRAKQA